MIRPKVSFGFCACVCLMAWLNWRVCICFLLSSACHEIGHLLTMRLFGVPVLSVRLGGAGAVIEAIFPDYKKEILCALAGPVAGVILGLLLLRSLPQMAMVSLFLSAVNLLPLYPLDGGRILRSCLFLLCPTWAERVCPLVTAAVCCLLMLLACWGAVRAQMGLWPIFASLVLLWRCGGRE